MCVGAVDSLLASDPDNSKKESRISITVFSQLMSDRIQTVSAVNDALDLACWPEKLTMKGQKYGEEEHLLLLSKVGKKPS